MKSHLRVLRSGLGLCLLLLSLGTAVPARALPALEPGHVLLQPVVSGLTRPVLVTNAADGSGRLFILDETGYIWIFKDGALLSTPFLDIHGDVRYGGEQGFLSLAFHPAYASNGYFYVAYTAPRLNDPGGSVVTLKRFSVSGDPDVASYASGTVILTVDHPTYGNHNGGTLAFGPDGYLYWSIGDGGGDQADNAQDLSVMLGKILRLDVDHTSTGLNYAVPPGNPFLESPDDPATLAEIWAYGLRNPWRMSFDRLTGDLYIGDVGAGTWEEVDVQLASSGGGQNYGWPMYEGDTCYSGPCDSTGKVFPVTVYDHSGGRCAISGGYVYRGPAYPALHGYYFYGDYCSGDMYALADDSGTWVVTSLPDTSYSISSFGEDEQGEVYVVDLNGAIYRLRYRFRAPSDFDGDGRTDPAKYVPAAGAVYYYRSTTSEWDSAYVGVDGEYVRDSDFDGDSKADPAKYVPAAGAAWYLGSADSTWHGVYIGTDGQYVPASDFDGDGVTDPAKYVSAEGAVWYFGSSDSTWHGLYIGSLGGGEYVPGSDFDGDGKTDPAHTDAAGNVWYVGSTDSIVHGLFLGNDGPYIPRSDYDGDGVTDPAKFVSPYIWYLASGNSNALTGIALGSDTTVVVPGGDFDGDGFTDPAKFVDSAGAIWYTRSSDASPIGVYMGADTYDLVD